ncbi:MULTISPECIES: helix-turn-helix transcriptional regulator [Aquimarina]|uniref:helix-turn-helix transcriptional regulator n=1 Tax=Aquimarina TaxID=290174 RepID=UPI000D69A85F|nr:MULTISPECIES: AraC family transcriptional regulator [Aquimarina]
MVKLEEVIDIPKFSNQLENKVLYSNHSDDISISYDSTYTLKYVIEGVKHYSFNNQNIEVSKNQYLILNNNSRITTNAKRGTKGLSFFLSPKLINEVYSYHTNTKPQPEFLEVIQKQTNNNVSLLLEKITHLYEKDSITFKHQIDHLFIRLSETIIQEQINIDHKFSALKIIKHNTKKELFQRVSLAKEYLNDNISNTVSLEKISSNIGISKYYLHRLFTEINGITPLEYLTSIRLEKAKNRLRYSKCSIFEIAIECGFDNISYFSNTFKKHIGSSPTQYRNNV